MSPATIIAAITSLVPILFKKKPERIQMIREWRRQYKLFRKEFRRKDSEGGREITKSEQEVLDHVRNKIIEAEKKPKKR